MRITYLGKEVKYKRTRRGQFRSQFGFIKLVTLAITVGIALFAIFASLGLLEFGKVIYIKGESAGVLKANRASQEKIKELQDDVLNTLSVKCETNGVKEPDAAIIFDSNNAASLGRFQFQVKTVQFYWKKFHGEDLNRVDAIRIAIDPAQATELARLVIFKDGAVEKNWFNCTKWHGLSEKVDIINKLNK